MWSGVARFLVEFIRINPKIYLGMSNAQIASIGSVIAGLLLLIWSRRQVPAHRTVVARTRAGRDFRLQRLQIFLHLIQLRKAAFILLKLAGVNAAASTAHAHRVLEMQHLVVDEIFNGETRGLGGIEDAADDDGVVCRVIMANNRRALCVLQVSTGRPSRP